MERRKFTKEFKQEAVKMVVEDGVSKAEAGRRLKISQGLLCKWVSAAAADGEDAFRGNGRMTPLEAENKRLQRELKELRMENEFLKKSTIYFASLKK